MLLNTRLFAATAGLGLAVAIGSVGFVPAPVVRANVPPAAPAAHGFARSFNAPQDDAYQIPMAKYVGTSSCASMACHNMIQGKGQKGSEYSTWGAYDPHSKAYSVLFNERSIIMERNYRALRGESGQSAVPSEPWKDALCLKCHAVNPPAELTADGGGFDPNIQLTLHDGVGCEGCHGAGELYRTTHYLPGVLALSDRQKAEQYGLWPTGDLVFRTKMCGTCHIGQPDMEVNHDLIAAGHPVLKYEASGYHNIYPKHWPMEKGYGKDFQARNWAIGQAASAVQALELLIHRAECVQSGKCDGAVGADHHPWPELAEYDCYSCHRTIETNTWRQAEGPRPGAKIGTSAWGVWYYPSVRLLAETPGLFASPFAGIRERLDELAVLLQQPYPPPGRVIAAARPLRDQLDLWAKQMQADAERAGAACTTAPPTDLNRLMDAYLAHGTASKDQGDRRIQDWDDATQTYMALTTLYQTVVDMDAARQNPHADAALKDARSVIAFPKPIAGQFLDFPREFTPAKFRAKLGIAGALLPRPAGQ